MVNFEVSHDRNSQSTQNTQSNPQTQGSILMSHDDGHQTSENVHKIQLADLHL